MGFARTAVHETPQLQFQNVDIASLQSLNPHSLAKRILRFNASTSIPELERKRLLWAIEPEIVVNSEDEELVPRLHSIAARNDRYNSARREITHEVDISQSPAVLQKGSDGWSLREMSRWTRSTATESHINIEVSHSVMSALWTSQGHKFLVLGAEVKTKTKFLALVPSLLSIITIPTDSAIMFPETKLTEAELLTSLAAQIIAITVVDPLASGQTVVLHNPTDLLAQAIGAEASAKNVRTHFLVDSTQSDAPASWTKITPYMTKSAMARVLPANIDSFVELSIYSGAMTENVSTILSILPPHARRETMASLYSSTAWDRSNSSASALASFLQRALESSPKISSHSQTIAPDVVGINNLLDGASPENPGTIIDWAVSKPLPVHVTRLDSAAFFKGDKTYWMCGLSGALGVSLCDWMIERGAKCLVLTSRNPNISPDWIEAHKKNGVRVTIVPW